MPSCSPWEPIRRISLSLMASFSSCTCLLMAETPPFLKSQNADTKSAPAQQQTAFRQSDHNIVDLFAHAAGGEADASPSLFCLISISVLRPFVNNFFPLLNIFPHSGKNNACTGGGGPFRLGPQPNCRISKGGVPSCLRTIRIRTRSSRTVRISRIRSRSATRRKTASNVSLFKRARWAVLTVLFNIIASGPSPCK